MSLNIRIHRGITGEMGFGVVAIKLLYLATSTLERFKQRIIQLYEQGADYVCIGEYVRHWLKWVRGGITGRNNILISVASPSSSHTNPAYFLSR